ncbi:MAG: hypothetical protein AB1696_27870 [Planctomycetota bacterium]
MKVEVKLHAQLRKFAPKKGQDHITLDVAEGIPVKDLVKIIGVPIEKAKLIIINGKRGEASDKLPAGAVVDLFPPIAGG